MDGKSMEEMREKVLVALVVGFSFGLFVHRFIDFNAATPQPKCCDPLEGASTVHVQGNEFPEAEVLKCQSSALHNGGLCVIYSDIANNCSKIGNSTLLCPSRVEARALNALFSRNVVLNVTKEQPYAPLLACEATNEIHQIIGAQTCKGKQAWLPAYEEAKRLYDNYFGERRILLTTEEVLAIAMPIILPAMTASLKSLKEMFKNARS